MTDKETLEKRMDYPINLDWASEETKRLRDGFFSVKCLWVSKKITWATVLDECQKLWGNVKLIYNQINSRLDKYPKETSEYKNTILGLERLKASLLWGINAGISKSEIPMKHYDWESEHRKYKTNYSDLRAEGKIVK